MFLLSVLSTVVVPMLCLVELVRKIGYGETVTFDTMLGNSIMYTFLMVGMMVACVIAAYLFSREQTENTLKTIMTLPVSKNKYLAGKFIALLFWMLFLSVITWLILVLVCFIGGASEPGAALIFGYLLKYVCATMCVYLTITPLIFITLWQKSLIPAIITAIMIAMVNILITNDRYVMLFPWSALLSIIQGGRFVHSELPIVLSYLSIGLTTVIGFIASFIYFNKQDIK